MNIKFTRKNDALDKATLTRSVDASATIESSNTEQNTFQIAISSETPYLRYFGYEVLAHTSDAIDFTRLNGAPVLWMHDHYDVRGILESVWLGEDKVLRGTVRMAGTEKGQELAQLIREKIVWQVSVGYQVLDMVKTGLNEGIDVFTVTKWQPFEVSMCSVAADNTVGVERKDDAQLNKVLTRAIELYQDEAQTESAGADKDAQAAQEQSAAQELERVNTLNDLGSRYRAVELAKACIEDGSSIEQFQAKLVELQANKNNNKKEMKNNMKKFNRNQVLRAMAGVSGAEMPEGFAAVNTAFNDALQAAGVQSQLGKRAVNVAVLRALTDNDVYNATLSDPSGAGMLVPTVFDAARLIQTPEQLSIAAAIKCKTEMLPGPLTAPRELFNPLPVIGHGERLPAAKYKPWNYSPVSYINRRIAWESYLTTTMLNTAQLDLMGRIEAGYQVASSKFFNHVVFKERETGESSLPKSIIDHAETVKVSGDVTDVVKAFDDAYLAVRNKNGNFTAWVMSPEMKVLAERTKIDAGSAKMLCENGQIRGIPVVELTDLAFAEGDTTSPFTVFGGDFSQMTWASFPAGKLTIDDITLASEGTVKMVQEDFYDFVIEVPEHLVALTIDRA